MAQLQVTIIEARNLKKKDTLSENDPFVEIYLDDKRSKQRTKTKQNCKTPRWNQTFVFNHLSGQDALHVDVYDEDPIKNEKIGSIEIDLRDLYQKGHVDDWFELKGRFSLTSHGQIHLALDYERLRV